MESHEPRGFYNQGPVRERQQQLADRWGGGGDSERSLFWNSKTKSESVRAAPPHDVGGVHDVTSLGEDGKVQVENDQENEKKIQLQFSADSDGRIKMGCKLPGKESYEQYFVKYEDVKTIVFYPEKEQDPDNEKVLFQFKATEKVAGTSGKDKLSPTQWAGVVVLCIGILLGVFTIGLLDHREDHINEYEEEERKFTSKKSIRKFAVAAIFIIITGLVMLVIK